MIVVASTNGLIGMEAALETLKAGGSAVDAVEAGIRLVEENPEDHSVGYSGYPNILGEVELDASIMDGQELTAGAVGILRGYTHAISVARKVMETLPHVFLVGRGAARFAAEMGFEESNLLTEEARQTWEDRLKADMPEHVFANLAEQPDLWKWVQIATDPERVLGTVNFIVQDGQGNICAGASTSGWAWKYPGRIGDSPVVGAGIHADNRYGAAACTGMGEMSIQASTAYSVVRYMRDGHSVVEAGRRAMDDLNDLGGRYLSRMNFIALSKDGQPAGFSNAEDNTYIYQTIDMAEPEKAIRTYVPTKTRWAKA